MYNNRHRSDAKVHPIGRTGDTGDIQVTKYDKRSLEGDIIVGNVQQFAKDKLYEHAIDNLSRVKIDLVIVDEGHHSAAESWQKVQSLIIANNPGVKFIFVTATPQRRDGLKYGIEQKNQIYMLKRKDAQIERFIKQTKKHPLDLSDDLKIQAETNRKDKVQLYSNPIYIKQIIVPAVEELLDLRKTCQSVKIQTSNYSKSN